MIQAPSKEALGISNDALDELRGNKLLSICGARFGASRDGNGWKDFLSFVIGTRRVRQCTPTGTKLISGGAMGRLFLRRKWKIVRTRQNNWSVWARSVADF